MLFRLLMILVVSSGPALAAEPLAHETSALYQATAIVTGMDMRQQPLGFAQCLTEVLVKVSGVPRLRDDPAVAELAKHADLLADTYAYVDPQAWRLHHDDQGTYDRSYEMTVRFNPVKVDAALSGLGVEAWRGRRPLLEPVILVRPIGPTPYLLSAETPRGVDMRAAIVRVAAEFGMGVRFPTEADLAAWGIIPFGFPAPLNHAEPNRLRISGSMAWDFHAMGWIGIWRLPDGGADTPWQISGVSFDAAFQDMVRGAVVAAHEARAP